MQKTFLRRVGQYIVRNCNVDDIRLVISINWATLPEHYSDYFFEELLRESPETFLVTENEHNGEVVGYIMCRPEYGFSNVKKFGLARKGHIVSVAVLEEYRQKGLGTALIEEAMKELVKKGYSEVYLEVRHTNILAIRLYERLGFRTITVVDGYYRDGEAATLMCASLG